MNLQQHEIDKARNRVWSKIKRRKRWWMRIINLFQRSPESGSSL